MATVAKPLTAEEFLGLPDNGQLQELVRGKIVEMPPPKFRHGVVCGNIYFIVRSHADAHQLGRVLSNDSGLITERDPDSVRGPDIAYYSFQRIPRGQEPEGYADVPPELIFEVLSPDDRWSRVQTKVAEYLAAGVSVVCVVDPEAETASIYRDNQPPRTLTIEEQIDLKDVLINLIVPVRKLLR